MGEKFSIRSVFGVINFAFIFIDINKLL